MKTLNKYTKLYLTGLLIFFLTISAHSQELMPLHVGNNWTYIRTEIKNGEVTKTDTVTSFIDKKVIINGKNWHTFHEDGFVFTLRNEGIHQYELDSSEINRNGTFREFIVFTIPAN